MTNQRPVSPPSLTEETALPPTVRKPREEEPDDLEKQSTAHSEMLARIDKIANLMDARFRVPWTGLRFGWDSILGLVPGVGDLITAAPFLIFLHAARRTDASRGMQLRMTANILIDLLLGAVPLLGDIFDFGFKAHKRNAKLLRKHLTRQSRP